MRGWSRIWWGAAALAVVAQALLLRLDQAQARVRDALPAGIDGTSDVWFGRDIPGYDTFSRVVYGLPQAWSVLGLVMVAVSVALWRESRVSLVAVPLALVSGILPAERLAVPAALLATAALAVAGARSARWRILRLTSWLIAGVVVLLVVCGAGRAPWSVELGSTAHLAGRAAVPVLLVVALVFLTISAVPEPAPSPTDLPEQSEARHRSLAWAVVAVAGAVQIALVGAVLVEHLPFLVSAPAGGSVQTVTVAIAQFSEPRRPIDLQTYLTVLATLSAAAAAVAALLLRAVHPLVLAAVACFVLAVLPVGATARSGLALAGFAILGVVALRTPRSNLG